MYKVIVTKVYLSQAKKTLSPTERETARNVFRDVLRRNPLTFGDPISFKFFREFRIEGKRIFYLVYKDYTIVLVVGTSKKKNQQKIINSIKVKLPKFKIFAQQIKIFNFSFQSRRFIPCFKGISIS